MAGTGQANSSQMLSRAERAARFGIDCGDGVLFGPGTWGLGGEYVGRLCLQNVTGRSLHLRYSLPCHRVFFMEFPDPLTVPPGMTATLEVRFRPVSYVPLEDCIQCSCETGSFSVPVRAEVARLEVGAPQDIDMGLVPVAEASEAILPLQNSGQVDAWYEVDTPQPFTVTPSRGRLGAGDTARLTVTVIPSDASKLRAQARVRVWPLPTTAASSSGDSGSDAPPPPSVGPPSSVCLTSLSAHAKFQHISPQWPPIAAAKVDNGGTSGTPQQLTQGQEGLASASITAKAAISSISGSDDVSIAPHLLHWSSVETDCGYASVSGPLYGGSSDSPPARRRLTKVVTVVNTGPVAATVSALRLHDGGDCSDNSDGATAAVVGDQHPPSFTVRPHSAPLLPPGASCDFAFTFHPHARGTCARTPQLTHWLLSCPGGNSIPLVTSATAVGPTLTIARKTRARGKRATAVTAIADAGDTQLQAESECSSAHASALSLCFGSNGVASYSVPPSAAPDVTAGVRASVCYGDVRVGAAVTQVLVLTNHASTIPAHWAVNDAEAGCGVFLLSQPAGIVPPSSSTSVVVTFLPPCSGNFYRRLTFTVRDGCPVTADVIGTAYSATQRPPPLRQRHIDRWRRLPGSLRFLPPDGASSELALLQSLAATAAAASTAGNNSDRTLPPFVSPELLSAASAEAAFFLTSVPTPCGDRPRAGQAQLGEMFLTSAASASSAITTDVSADTAVIPVGFSFIRPDGAGSASSSSSSSSSGSSTSGGPRAYYPLDFGCVSRSAPPEKRSVWVVNNGSGKVTVTWVAPVPPAVIEGQPRLGAQLLADPRGTTALLQLPSTTTSTSTGAASSSSEGIVHRDWTVTPESADVEPNGGATEFRIAFRPGQDARYYCAVLEAHVAPKSSRSFRLTEAEAVLPPVCLPLRVM